MIVCMYVCMYVYNLCAFVLLSRVLVRNLRANLLARSLVHHVIVVVVGSDGSGDDRLIPLTPSASTHTHTHIDDDVACRIGRYQERRAAHVYEWYGTTSCACVRMIWNARADCMNVVLLVYLVVCSLASCSLARCVMLLSSPVLSRSRIDGLYHSRSRE